MAAGHAPQHAVEQLESLDLVELVMAVEELRVQHGGNPAELERALDALCAKHHLTREQLDKLQAEIAAGMQDAKRVETPARRRALPLLILALVAGAALVLWLLAGRGF
jgi:hypothetical protein